MVIKKTMWWYGGTRGPRLFVAVRRHMFLGINVFSNVVNDVVVPFALLAKGDIFETITGNEL